MSSFILGLKMATKEGREQLSPVKKKFVSPVSQRRASKTSGISPKVRANLRDFHKFSQQAKKGDLGPKKKHQKGKPISFHLGGNSHDPLNLNSLIDRDPAVCTPQASPLASIHGDSPVPLCLPKDCTDPLNLKCFPSQDGKEAITTPKKKKKKKKNKLGQNDIENKEEKGENQNEIEVEEIAKNRKRRPKKKKVRKPKLQAETHNKSKTEETSENGNISEKPEEDKVVERSEIEETLRDEPPKKKKKKEDNKEKKTEDGATQAIDSKQPTGTEILKKTARTDASSESEPPQKKKKSEDLKCEKDMHQLEGFDTQNSEIATSSEVIKIEPNIETKTPAALGTGNKKIDTDGIREKLVPKGKIFIHGNYNRYYGYRNSTISEDTRLKSFRKEWFHGKDILDIGCNIGDITIAVAQKFQPRVIVGNDIDNSLIRLAKNNIRKFLNKPVTATAPSGSDFPISFGLTSGPIAAPILPEKGFGSSRFPQNVVFKQENYVPHDERALSYQKPMYDTILCLSVTKWVHLNNGDEGLKLMFKRMFRNLRPGGRLILEPQPLSSYRRKKNLTEKIRANYDKIKFMPEQFIDYLLSEEVGFAAFEVLDLPDHKHSGFQRPMYLFTKA